ncbi:TIGR03086 family metal-binding protein [Streptomyces sp. CAU 1734]|uniref:TIGR03086 family metal-binding protein n=1 Tax=Streptomyces sp. CAU 1734 TaxID=3140360 RepID=UPI0032601A02
MNDPRPLYERAAAQFTALLESVTPDRLGDPTPCAEFDIRALLTHSVDGLHLMAHIGEGGDWRTAPPRHSAATADNAWNTAYEDAHQRFTKAWSADELLGRTVSAPWGATMPGAALFSFCVLETVVHGWDLHRALGRPLTLDAALAEAIWPVARDELPASPRGGPVPFGEVRPAPGGAGPYTRLAAWLGREAGAPPHD